MPGLIFDYDGTMVDSERMLAECVVDTLGELGVTVGFEDFGHLFGSTEMDHEWERLIAIWCDGAVTRTEFDARVWALASPQGDELPLLPGVADLIEAARSTGWKVGLGTGQSWTRLEARLRRNNVFDCFDAIVTAGEVERGKPAPDVFLEVARRLDVPPADCIVLEDSVHGCEAALAAGMQVIVCPSPVTEHCEYPADIRRVASLAELTLDDLPLPRFR